MASTTTANQNQGWFNKQVQNLDKTRLGMMPVLISIQVAVGSIACLFISIKEGSTAAMALSVAATMACNAFFVAQSASKICLISYYASLIVNALLILMYCF